MGEVAFRAEYRADERPISFEADGSTHRVVEVLASTIVEDHKSRRRRHEYIVRTDAGLLYELSGSEDWRIRRF